MKVKEFATVVSGATPSSKCPEYYDGDIVWFTPKDLSDQGTKHVSHCENYITKAGFDSCSTTMLPAGSVLMSSRAPIGLLAIADVPCCTNQGFKSFDIDRSKCDPEYLYYYLKLHIKEVELLGSGTTFKEVSKESVENYDVALPDLNVQHHIISILRDIDTIIANNNAICSNLEAMAKLLYDYWFVQFDFPDENGKPYKSSGGKMVWNDELKREIPAGWEVKPLSDLCSFMNGINYDKNEVGNKKYRIVNVRNITASSLLLDDSDFDEIVLKSSQADRYLIADNDILIARSGTPGATRLLLNNDGNTIFCGFIIRCAPNDAALRYYLTYVLKRLEGTTATKTGGSILQNVSQDTLGRVIVIVPNGTITDSFTKRIECLHSLMQNAMVENQQLTSLRDFLLPMLMNGQVKVG